MNESITVKVHVPTPLRSYTGKKGVVDASGSTLAEVFDDLERRYPGIRFRVINEQGHLREHIKIFISQQVVTSLATPLKPGDAVHVVAAISGGEGCAF